VFKLHADITAKMRTISYLSTASLALLSMAAAAEESGPPDALFSAGSEASPEQAGSEGKDLTDAQLKEYDGSDPDKPLYLAINGTIYDVSIGRNFYGPGGHYGHFAGRDANRAWVTECWDSEAELTHDMRGVIDMFMPKYMDEELADAAEGKSSGDSNLAGLQEQSRKLVEKFGKPSKKERAKRKENDRPEAEKAMEQALGKWVSFFASSGKYPVVGKVLREEGWEKTAPEPPAVCESAMKKRPIRGGGKLDAVMNAPLKMGGDGGIMRDNDRDEL